MYTLTHDSPAGQAYVTSVVNAIISPMAVVAPTCMDLRVEGGGTKIQVRQLPCPRKKPCISRSGHEVVVLIWIVPEIARSLRENPEHGAKPGHSGV